MFLEMVKDMPRGRAESLGRLLRPLLAVGAAGLVVLGALMVDDARVTADLERQVERQAESAGVLFLDPPVVPRDGERDVLVLVDGRRVDGLVQVSGGVATLLVRGPDGELAPVAPAD